MPHFEIHVQDLIVAIKAKGGREADLAPLFLRLSADVITGFMFGKSIRSLARAESIDTKFMDAFQGAQDGGEARFRMGVFADWMPGQEKFWESVKWVHAFMDEHVDEALRVHRATKQRASESLGDEKGSKEEKGGYIFLQEIAKMTDDREVLRDELLTIFFAGRDSTAATLTNLFFNLARKPDVWQRLRKEVMLKLRGDLPSFPQLKELDYLQNCINESKFSNFLPNLL